MPDSRHHGTAVMYLLPLLMLIVSLFMGRYQVPVSVLIDDIMNTITALFFGTAIPASTPHTVLFSVRLPRILAAMLVGCALSVAGVSFQGVFRNPLVSPYILGVGSGAGFGACLGILLFDNHIMIQLLAFIFKRNTPQLAAAGIKGMRIQFRLRSAWPGSNFMRQRLGCPAACGVGALPPFHWR